MTKLETYDTHDARGVVKEYPIGMAPITAESVRKKRTLTAEGAEVHSGHVVVNPLNRMPSLKSMVDGMKRSGQLAARIRAAENMRDFEEGDPSFEGYTREWLEENWLSQQEADYITEEYSISEPEGTTEVIIPLATPPAEAPAEPTTPPPEA